MTRWLVTGAAGMLGRDLTALLTARGEEFTALTRADLDITDGAAAASAVSAVKPDVVVNCAAWTAVDAAEEHEAQALAINGHGAGEPGRGLRRPRRGPRPPVDRLRLPRRRVGPVRGGCARPRRPARTVAPS